ncbi:hypothetical protein Dimus_033968 [Dionaea muscipula]
MFSCLSEVSPARLSPTRCSWSQHTSATRGGPYGCQHHCPRMGLSGREHHCPGMGFAGHASHCRQGGLLAASTTARTWALLAASTTTRAWWLRLATCMVPGCGASRIFVHGAGFVETRAWSSPLPAQAPSAVHQVAAHVAGRTWLAGNSSPPCDGYVVGNASPGLRVFESPVATCSHAWPCIRGRPPVVMPCNRS